MANKFQNKAKLIDRIVHNEKYIECVFELSEPFSEPFLAGQYVSIKVAEPNTLRSYSICSDPADQSRFALMIDVTPQGVGTTFLQTIEVGTEVELLGPLGRFTLSQGVENKPVVLIGTGSGVAPLKSMAVDLIKNRNTQNKVLLLWGERFSKTLIWHDELNKLSFEHQNFELRQVISRPEDGEECTKGRVTTCLQDMELLDGAEYYLCGGKEMIDETVEILKSKGVLESSIFHENFY
jgi:NAD(P)H-flavin reductase